MSEEGSSAAGGSPDLPDLEYLSTRLEDAERLLGYAADIGAPIDPDIRAHVLAARQAKEGSQWTVTVAQNLLTALTVLSDKLRPVSGESLRLCSDDVESVRLSRFYKRVAIVLAAFIVPFSLATFVTSGISSNLRADLTKANELAVTLSNELRESSQANVSAQTEICAPQDRTTPAEPLPAGVSQKDVIQHLQEFASLTRAIYANGRHLNIFVFAAVKDPFPRKPDGAEQAKPAAGGAAAASSPAEGDRRPELELEPDIPNFSAASTCRIFRYQGIRYFAQTVDSLVSIIYGAFAACVLPVLYALLGACAFLLRRLEEQVRNRTLTDSDAHLARFVIAGIAGAVIGLFNNFKLTDTASVSPLALAFLVGYAADVFFAFLEALVQSFNKSKAPPPPPSPPTR